MQLQRWGDAFIQRVFLFVVAGLFAVALLHLQAGITPAAEGRPPGFSPERWLASGRAYVGGLVHGEMGVIQPLGLVGYMREIPVAAELQARAPASLLLLALALAVSLGGGTLLGLLSSRFGPPRLRTPTLLGSLLLLSTPDILVVLGLRMLLIWTLSTFGLKLFSLTALGSSLGASHFIAPTLALSSLPLAIVARVAAVAFDEAHGQLYIRTAHAKGASQRQVLLRHALKNAWIRVSEAGPLVMASLVTGLVVVEYILYFPGVGRTLGLVLEKGGQPAASAGIALLLLAWAMLIDIAFAAVRLGLDPRLENQGGNRREPGLVNRWRGGTGVWVSGARRGSDSLLLWVKAIPGALVELAWPLRPGRLLREVRQNPPLLAGLIGVGALGLVALFGGNLLDLSAAHKIPRYIIGDGEVFFPPYSPGTPGYPLGSDMAGRDLLSRLVFGTRYTLFFTLAVTPIRFVVALPWGLAAGLRGGLWRTPGRALGMVFSAVPVLLVPAALLPLGPALGLDPNGAASFWLITGVLAAAGIPRLVEQIRQHTEAVAVQPFIEGAVAVGASPGRVLWRHILPHLVPQLWVTAATDMAWTLLLLAQFGIFSIFLAGSVKVAVGLEAMGNSTTILMSRIPDWSSMLSRPYDVIFRAPWSLWLPALAFLLAITAFNLVAEGLRRRAERFEAEDAPEDGSQARRRLALEWAGAVLVLALLAGATVRYGLGAPEPVLGRKVGSPLEEARLALRVVLEQATGSAPDEERVRAAGALHRVVGQYIVEMQKAGLPLSRVEEETQGRVRLLDGDGYQLMNAYIPNHPNNDPSYVFVIEKQSGRLLDAFQTLEKVHSFAYLPGSGQLVQPTSDSRRRFDHLIIAGPIPSQGDRWGLSVWIGAYGANPIYIYTNQETVFGMERVYGDPYGFREIKSPKRLGRWLAMKEPVGQFHVAPNGDLTICATGKGPCGRFLWQEGRWLPAQ